MDTAQKLLKTIALLLAAALLMAAPAWADTPVLLAPSTVTIGSQGFNTVDVTSSAAGTTEITYTVLATTYPVGNTSANWLAPVTASALKTPATLTFALRNNSFAGINNGASATVTLHPSNGAADVTITVNFDGTGSGGSGSSTLTASATTVNLTAAANNQSSTTVNISTNSVSNITINATTSATLGNWLSVTPVSSTLNSASGSTLTITAAATGLTAGSSYQGTVTVTPSTGTPLTITVMFSVGASVGNGVWTASPGTVGWNFTTNGANFPSQAISVTSSSASTTYNVTTSSSNGWLQVYLPSVAGSVGVTSLSGISVATQFGVKLGSQANLLGASTVPYTGQALIYDSSGNFQIGVTVSLTVSSGGVTGLTMTPNPVSFTAALNSAQQSQTVNVTSGPGGVLSITGTLPTGLTYQLPNNTNVAPGGVIGFNVSANPAGLGANTYTGTLFVVVGGQSATLTVTMVVGGGGTGTTAVAPTALNFYYQLGTDPVNFVARQKLVLTGPAGAWSSTISTFNGVSWLRLSPANGISLPDPAISSQAPVVSVDPTDLAVGTYTGTITVTTPGGAQSIAVSLTVAAGTVLLPTPGSLVFTAQTGRANPAGQVIYISGSNGALNPLALTATSNNTWIAVTVTDPERSISVQVDQTGLTTGVYSGSVLVTQTGAANSPSTIPVVLVVNGGGSGGTGGGGTSTVTVTPASLAFSASTGSTPAAQSLSVNSASGSAGVAFTVQVTPGASWLSTNAGASNTTPLTNLAVSVASGSLAAGSYTGNIVITPTGGTAINVPVFLTVVAGATTVSATPTTLTFDYRAGDNPPSPKQVTVSGGGAALAFSATPSSTGNWLVVSPASGATAATGTAVNVSINPTGLSTGTYTGTIVVAGTSGASGSTTITVTLNVTAPLPTITKVTNAASYATGSIAPGEIITLFAGDPTHPIGPATAAFLTLDAAGKVSTTIGGVQVLVNGFACPMTYASASQVSAVVPYELKLFTTANVLVKFLGQSSNGVTVNVATTVPGVFTANSSGTGPGAILNSDGVTGNSAAFPATRGDTVVLYLTGEGETSPAGVTGKVTTVAAPPQPLTPKPLLPVSVTIGGQPAAWSFAGEAPGFVSGAMQLNVAVPTNIAAGDQFVVVTIGGNQSQQGVTVSVK